MRRNPQLRRIPCNLCMVRKEIRLPHERDERQDRSNADRLEDSTKYHHNNEKGTMPEFTRCKDRENPKE